MSTVVRAVAERVFIPLTVGGGIRTEDDARRLFEAGADKVSLNTAALADPDLIAALARRYGSQAVVVAIDARREAGGWRVFSHSGRVPRPLDARDWAAEAADRGAGEILLTSIDRDGTREGFDCALTAAVGDAVPVPVIASGGAGLPEHFAAVFEDGRADAALAASIFHTGVVHVGALKQSLAARDIPMRLHW
jgi:cyclase